MYKIPIKMKIEDEFFNFIRKFQKIGEIEKGTILMGVKCLDSEGCLSRIKLFLSRMKKKQMPYYFTIKQIHITVSNHMNVLKVN